MPGIESLVMLWNSSIVISELLGVPERDYATINLPRTQQIGAAVEFLGCDGLIAPSARWTCDNLVLFPGSLGADATLEVLSSESVDWLAWATEHGIIA